MTNENITHTHELVVRFDQHEDGTLSWQVQPDSAVLNTLDASYEGLAEAGAPLAALGIRSLFEMLDKSLINIALDKASNYLWKEHFKRLSERVLDDQAEHESMTSNQAEGPMVIH